MGFGVLVNAVTGNICGFFDASSAGCLQSTVSVVDGNWHHIVFQNDGSTTSLFIDGVFQASQAETLFTGNGNIYVGATNLNASPFQGELDQIRIYDRLITPEEARAAASCFPQSENIPTMGEWSLAIVALLLLIASVIFIKEKTNSKVTP